MEDPLYCHHAVVLVIKGALQLQKSMLSSRCQTVEGCQKRAPAKLEAPRSSEAILGAVLVAIV